MLPFTFCSITVATNAQADGRGVEVGGFKSRLTFILWCQTTKAKGDDDGYKWAVAISTDHHIMMRCSTVCVAEHLFRRGAFAGQRAIRPAKVSDILISRDCHGLTHKDAGFQSFHDIALHREEEGRILWSQALDWALFVKIDSSTGAEVKGQTCRTKVSRHFAMMSESTRICESCLFENICARRWCTRPGKMPLRKV